jgi:hypothetical protein
VAALWSRLLEVAFIRVETSTWLTQARAAGGVAANSARPIIAALALVAWEIDPENQPSNTRHDGTGGGAAAVIAAFYDRCAGQALLLAVCCQSDT